MNDLSNSASDHLTLEDLERVTASADAGLVPLLCNEEDCFVDGSELDSSRTAAIPAIGSQQLGTES